MSFRFDPHQGLIVVQTEVEGPTGNAILRLALDTGATRTLVHPGLLLAVGYDPAALPDRIEVTTGSGIEFAPQVTLNRIRALGQQRQRFAVLAHALPPSAGIDGLLGLDFLRTQILRIDFRTGQVDLS